MSRSPFLQSLQDSMLARHYSKRTIASYLYWITQFIRFHGMRHPRELGAAEVMAYLTFLATQREVSVATQKITLNALAWLYNKHLDQPLGALGHFNKSSRQRKLPVVLTREEVAALLARRKRPTVSPFHQAAFALSGNNSSMRLLGQVGSFSSVSLSHA